LSKGKKTRKEGSTCAKTSQGGREKGREEGNQIRIEEKGEEADRGGGEGKRWCHTPDIGRWVYDPLC
jgi:hypothetical protein